MSSGRIERMVETLAGRGCKAFTAYFMAGDPDPGTSFQCIQAAIDAGASQIELGVPYSDPAADGPVIRRAGTRALAAGIRMADVFGLAGRIRKANEHVPIALMLYFNLVFRYGVDRFFQDCARTGIDACILPDLPLEEQDEVREPALQNGIRLIQLVAPNSGAGIPEICRRAEGFLYCVSTLGTTGERSGMPPGLDAFLDQIALYTDVPRFVGFGISRPDQAAAMSRHAEGIIVGSALVRLVLESHDPASAVGDYVASMCRQLCVEEKSGEVSL